MTLYVTLSDDALSALGVPLRAGRYLNSADSPQAPLVILVNEAFRRAHFPNEDPLGKAISFGTGKDRQWLRIVGVVGDVRQFALERAPEPMIYFSARQEPENLRASFVIIRTAGDPRQLEPALQRTLARIDKNLPLFDVRTMEQRLSDSLGPRRFNALLVGSFAVMAIFLAAVGIYGVMSYLVGLRLHEMGIRLALGAQPRQVLRLVLKEGALLGIVGTGLGLAGAFALSRYLSTLLFGVSARDPQVFAALSFSMLAIALIACYIPGRRAAKVDPVTALRHD